jgi:hypothetical protein
MLVPHGDDLAELELAVLDDVDAFGKLPPLLVLVLGLQVHLPATVDIVKNGANFGKTRQDLSHQDLWLIDFALLDIIHRVFLYLFVLDLLVFVLHLKQPSLHVYLPI